MNKNTIQISPDAVEEIGCSSVTLADVEAAYADCVAHLTKMRESRKEKAIFGPLPEDWQALCRERERLEKRWHQMSHALSWTL